MDWKITAGLSVLGLLLLTGLFFAYPAYSRYQRLLNAQNEISVNALKIQQTEQLVQVEQQRARIRVEEAKGIAEAQHIVNATLTDRYLQHEAIQAQIRMADSPNHSTVYIPTGQMGIPLVKTVDEVDRRQKTSEGDQ